MYFAIYCEDKPDSTEKRRSVRAAHLARLEELQHEKRLLIAGPLLSDDKFPLQGGFKGSLIVADFPNKQSADAWAAADPYITADIYAKVTVLPFKKVLPIDE